MDKNLLLELNDPDGVENFFGDERTRKEVLKIERRIVAAAKRLNELGFSEVSPLLGRVTKFLGCVTQKEIK